MKTDFEKDVINQFSVEVVNNIKRFFTINEDECLTALDFKNIQEISWKKVKSQILEKEKIRLNL